MKKSILILSCFVFVVIAQIFLQITLSSQMASAGTELILLQSKVETLKKQNLIIQQKVLQSSSLDAISQKAKKLGYIEDNAPVYLTAPIPLALNQ